MNRTVRRTEAAKFAKLTKRRLYKPERAPARKKTALYNCAPVGLLDADDKEVSMAIFALARASGVVVGQGSGYDALRDEYTVIGKSMETGKAQDFKIQGLVVAELIAMARRVNGGPLSKRETRKRAAAGR